MKNFIQEGDRIILVAGGTVTSGSPVFIGGSAAIPVISGISGDSIPCQLEGVFELTKKESLAITQGDNLYWDSTPGEITKTLADGVYIGRAFAAAGGSDSTVMVKLNAARQAASVADASAGSAAEINALRDALIAAGLIAKA
jgi:predicted RecA/RadA family phage recombinase